jgi:hypothetical protein
MSRIGSSSGVRVASAPLSNVYTVLLLVGALILVLVLVAVMVTNNTKYGVVIPASDEGKAAMQKPDQVKAMQATATKSLDEKIKEMKDFVMDPGHSARPEAPAATTATPTDAATTPTGTEAGAVAPAAVTPATTGAVVPAAVTPAATGAVAPVAPAATSTEAPAGDAK